VGKCVVKSTEKWNLGDWFLHCDNAPAHSDLSLCELLAKNNMIVIPHPLCSPDLAPCNSFLFLKLKMALKGRRFNDVTMIQVKLMDPFARFQTFNTRKCFEW
jgi:hypothetical protein